MPVDRRGKRGGTGPAVAGQFLDQRFVVGQEGQGGRGGLGGSLTLTASGGPVSWSVMESSGLIGTLSVAPSSGRLRAGESTTVSVNASGGLLGLASRAVPGTGGGVCVGCQLTVNPGGIVVSVVIEVDVTPSSPPPSSRWQGRPASG